METRSTSTSRPTRRLPRPRTEYPGTSPEPNPRATIYAPCPTAKAQVSEPVGHGAPGSVSMDWVAPVSTALPHYRTRGADRRWFELPADRLSWRRDRAGQSLDARRRLYGDYTAALSRMRTALNECAQTNIRVLRDTRDLLLRSPEPGDRQRWLHRAGEQIRYGGGRTPQCHASRPWRGRLDCEGLTEDWP